MVAAQLQDDETQRSRAEEAVHNAAIEREQRVAAEQQRVAAEQQQTAAEEQVRLLRAALEERGFDSAVILRLQTD